MAESSSRLDPKGEHAKNEANDTNVSSNDSQEREFKVILLGMSGVGKTSLFLYVKDGRFYKDTTNMKTDKPIKRSIQVGQRQVEMTLYDSAAGMEYHEKTLTKDYYRDSCIALLVYSADSIDTVAKLVKYIEVVKEYEPQAKIIVIRNKVDLDDQTVKDYEVSAKITGEGYVVENTIQHFCCTSALNGNGIDNLLSKIGKTIIEIMNSSTRDEAQVNRFDSFRCGSNQRTQSTEQSRSGCC